MSESESFPVEDQQQESDSKEVEEEHDLYDELIDAMNGGNDQLKVEMMERILYRFEAVGGDGKKKLKGKIGSPAPLSVKSFKAVGLRMFSV